MKVFVVLATYNGVRYLDEQLRSLRDQDFSAWELLARDDGSTDGTPELLRRHAIHDRRLKVLEGRGRLGVIANFGELMRVAVRHGADYVFPCDQDDVWKPQKMSRALALMSELEARHGRETPILVHSDLEVTDGALRTVHESYLKFERIRRHPSAPLNLLLMQNSVTGCAALLNRQLLEIALPFPEGCIMHDWWIALCAAARGHIGFLPHSTILYRQHFSNQVGSRGTWSNISPFHVGGRKTLARSWRTLGQLAIQARLLHSRLVERGNCAGSTLELVEAFSRLTEDGPRSRIRTLRRLGIPWHADLGSLLLFMRMGLLGTGLVGDRATPLQR
ncbi:MAG: glycosyltransferase family 2 protein [Myxococcaceae bacterium]